MTRPDFLCRATAAERHAALPGDEIIPHPVCQLDHGIDVQTPPEAIWPWLAQMGADRAGWYSYDRLDNGGRPSLWQIRPELQNIAVGDVFPALPGATDAFVLTGLEAYQYLVLGVPSGPVTAVTGSDSWRMAHNRANWTFFLSPKAGGSRLHVRARLGHLRLRLPVLGDTAVPGWLARLLAPPVHFIMQRKQLNSIRKRAEMP